MRTILSILTVFALTLGTLRDCAVVLTFTLNRAYIAKNLCERRDQPGNTCQGSCQLCKQLNNDDHGDRAPDSRSMTELDDLQPVTLAAAFMIFSPGSSRYFAPQSAAAIPSSLIDQIDHPPEFFLA